MSKPIRILYIDDNPLDRELVRDALEKEHGGFELVTTASRADFETALAKGGFDLVLSDFNILGFDGLQVIEAVHAKDATLPIVIVTGTGSEEIAVEALKRGAADYVIKTPKHILRLPLTIHAVLEKKHLQEDRDRLFNLSLDLLCVAGFDGYFKQLNPAWEKTLGWSNKELLSKPYLDFVHPDDREATSHATAILIDGQLVYFFENRYLCKDGAYKWISWNSYPLVEEELIFAVARDITERKQAEATLHDSQMQLEGIFNTTMDAIITIDEEHKIIIFNPAAEQMFRCKASEASGETLDRFIPEYFRDRHKESVRAFGQSNLTRRSMSTSTLTFTSLRADGEAFPSEISISQLEIGGGKLYTAIVRDVTERKLAEDELRQAEQKYRNIFENAMEGIHQTTYEGKYISVNPAAARILGYDSPEELMSSVNDLNTQFYVEPQRREEFVKLMEAQEAVSSFESEVYRKDGSRVWVSENMHTVRDEHGALLYYEGTSEDITKRKQAEEKLQQSEDRYRDLVENSQDLICTHDLEGMILSANPASARLLGYELDELIGKNLRDFMAPEVRRHFKYYINRLTQRGTASGLLLMQTRQGEQRIWEYQNSVRSEGVAEPIVRGMARDVTERKRAEDEIRRLKEFDENLINNMSEGIVVQNTDGYFTFVNPAAMAITGYLPEELLGEHWTKFFFADQQEVIKEADNRRLAGEATQYEVDFLHKSGKRINMLVSGSPLFENERINGTMAVFTDITERKRAEEKIRQQLQRLTALREIDQIIASTLDVGSSLNVLTAHTVNLLAVDAVTVLLLNSATNMLEYGAGLGFWTDAVKTANVKLGESYAGRAATEGRTVNIPNLADEPNNLLLTGFLKGENFVSYYGAPLIVKEKVIGVLEVFHRSIVERDTEWLDFFNTLAGQASIAIDNAKMFENLQRTNIELEMRVEERTVDLIKANRAKDEFLANMSHELRTPLNAVLNISESLEEGTYGELKPRQIESLHVIAESGRHLLELINDILDLSKIEAGKLELQVESVAVEAYCQASMRMIKETAFQKRLQVSMSNTSNVEVIYADGRRLKQMLVNLLSNAVKFTPANGQIGLEVSKEGDHAIRFCVWDTGIGIPADQLEKLFNPFVQLDSSLSRQYMGTGLGLALVRNLAELQGGSVGVESELGKGSRFYFIIPTQLLNAPIVEKAKPSAGLKPDETTTKPNGEKRRILLVEDNVTNMLVTSDYLSDKGYQVIGASDGLEAIAFAKEQKPDLILMDIQMPGISGIEAIKQLRAIGEFDSVPIIALTALAMSGDRERCLQAGANEYITKPASLKDLVATMQRLMER